MASVLILEDGSGSDAANTFVTLAEVVAYCAARRLAFPSDQTEGEAAVIEAGEYLNNDLRYNWRGTRTVAEQVMSWPRTGVIEYRGPAIDPYTIPWRVKQAQCYLAYLASTEPGELDAILDRGGMIKSRGVGPINTTFMDSAPVERVIQKVQGLLYPLLLTPGRVEMGGVILYQAVEADPDVFAEDAFNNPGSGT